ncbi:MAG: prepilin peptidase [Dehalococcoidia bacterium]
MEHLAAIVLAFVLGAVVASFLNVVADRVPRGQSIVRPPSHCPDCGHELKAVELIPVLSYLLLRGKCRVCAARIPARVPIVELIGGLLFAFAIWRYGFTLDGALAALFFGALLLIAVIDLEHKLVLNVVLLAALPLAVLSTLGWSPDVRLPVLQIDGWYLSLLADSLLAGGAGFAVFLALAVFSRGGVGAGDVKLAGVLGIWLGLRVLPVALMLAVVLGGVVAALLLVSRASGRKDAIPFAPFLCAGAAAGLVWGEAIGNWYLDLVTGPLPGI